MKNPHCSQAFTPPAVHCSAPPRPRVICSRSPLLSALTAIASALPALMTVASAVYVLGCTKADGATENRAGSERTSPAGGAAAKIYSSRGVIKAFGPDRKYINIAHEEIPGYMAAMIMAFEASPTAPLDGFAVGDRISFSFRSEDDGRQILTSIKREP